MSGKFFPELVHCIAMIWAFAMPLGDEKDFGTVLFNAAKALELEIDAAGAGQFPYSVRSPPSLRSRPSCRVFELCPTSGYTIGWS